MAGASGSRKLLCLALLLTCACSTGDDGDDVGPAIPGTSPMLPGMPTLPGTPAPMAPIPGAPTPVPGGPVAPTDGMPPAPPATPTPPVVSPDVVWETCSFEIPAGTTPKCGFLPVPENRADATQGEIELHFAIFPAMSAPPLPDPVVYLEGGPGGAPLNRAALVYELLLPAVGTTRDLVVVDQRGTGRSQDEPFTCRSEVMQAALGFGGPAIVSGLRACGERLRGAGVDVAAYNSRENAADFEELRVALGYPPWNLLGISYGTFLGQVILRDHAAGVRSAVLDSTLPVAGSYADMPGNVQRALDVFFETCAADATCRSSYPSLETTFYALLDRLATSPVSANIQLPGGGLTLPVPVQPALLLNACFNGLYNPAQIAVLPRMIASLNNGNSELFATMYNAIVAKQEGISDGMHYAVTCYDRVAFTTADELSAAAAAFPPISPMVQGFLGRDAPAACAAFGAGQPNASEHEPVRAAIPTLVIGGHFDPVTPPEGGSDVAAELAAGHFIEFPWQGHGAIRSPCAQGIVRAFLDAPSVPPNRSCVTAEPAFSFLTPTDPLPLVSQGDGLGMPGMM